MHALIRVHEGQGIAGLDTASDETGCMQCHGTKIELDSEGRPTPETWPNAGMGNVYPNGSTGSCTACHTRHLFSLAESRKPQACASCHLGPDHPDIEIFENSKHGQVKRVCKACHTSLHADDFFSQGDKAVRLYNEGYYRPAKRLLEDLRSKGLLRKNPWTDPFQIKFYYLWHHEGRRARQGALMGAPDYAHWHGFFELQLDLYELQGIYDKRIASGEIED